jgi:hypothetical protein
MPAVLPYAGGGTALAQPSGLSHGALTLGRDRFANNNEEAEEFNGGLAKFPSAIRALIMGPVTRSDYAGFYDMVLKAEQHALYVTRVQSRSVKPDDKFWGVISGDAHDGSFEEVAVYVLHQFKCVDSGSFTNL